MSVIDRRDESLTYEGGSSLLAVYLAAAQATAAFDGLAAPEGGWLAGWYSLGYLTQTEFGRDRDAEVERDEAGEVIKTRVSRDEFLLTPTLRQTDDHTLQLVEWLEDNFVPARYLVPAGVQAFDDGQGGTEEAEAVQVYGFPNVQADKTSNKLTASNGSPRTLQTPLRASRRGGAALFVRRTVRADDQTAWPAALAPFKDTPA